MHYKQGGRGRRCAALVDFENLRCRLGDIWPERPEFFDRIDPLRLAISVVEESPFRRLTVFGLYTARRRSQPSSDEHRRLIAATRAAAAARGIEYRSFCSTVEAGRAVRPCAQCGRGGKGEQGGTQKGVDTTLAVDLYRIGTGGDVDEVFLFAADTDYAHPIAVTRADAGKRHGWAPTIYCAVPHDNRSRKQIRPIPRAKLHRFRCSKVAQSLFERSLASTPLEELVQVPGGPQLEGDLELLVRALAEVEDLKARPGSGRGFVMHASHFLARWRSSLLDDYDYGWRSARLALLIDRGWVREERGPKGTNMLGISLNRNHPRVQSILMRWTRDRHVGVP